MTIKNQTSSYLAEVYNFHLQMLAINVSDDHKQSLKHARFEDMCVKTNEEKCYYYSVLDFWRFSIHNILNDNNTHHTVLQNMSTSFHQPLLRHLLLDEVHDEGTFVGASAFLVLFYLNYSDSYENLVKKWKNAFADTAKEFSKNSSFIKITYQHIASKTEDSSLVFPRYDPYIYLSLGLMILFFIALSFSFNCIKSKVLVGVVGAGIIPLSVVVSTGLCGLFSVKITSLSQTLFFLISVIGINHMFLICNVFDRVVSVYYLESVDFEKGKEKNIVVKTMEIVLPMITIELTVEIAIYLCLWVVTIPGFTTLGQQAALMIGCLYFLLVTLFAACLSIDSARVANFRADILPCCKCTPDVDSLSLLPSDQETEYDDGALNTESIRGSSSKKRNSVQLSKTKKMSLLSQILKRYASILYTFPLKLITLICVIGLLGVAVYGLTIYWDRDFSSFDLMDSYTVQSHSFISQDHSKLAYRLEPMQMVVGEINYTDPDHGMLLLNLTKEVNQSQYVTRNSFNCWYDSFLSFLANNKPYNQTLNGHGIPSAKDFYPYLSDFLQTPNGAYFNGDLEWKNNTHTNSLTIKNSRFRLFTPRTTHNYVMDQVDKINGLNDLKKLGIGGKLHPYASLFSFFMTFPAMRTSTYIYLIASFVALSLVLFVQVEGLLWCITTAAIALGWSWFSGITLNFYEPPVPNAQIALSAFLIFTSLIVNNCLHLRGGNKFNKLNEDSEDAKLLDQPVKTPEQRSKENMEEMLTGMGVSTTKSFLCIFVASLFGLLTNDTQAFTFMALLISSILFAYFLSISFLPVSFCFLDKFTGIYEDDYPSLPPREPRPRDSFFDSARDSDYPLFAEELSEN
eukprot:CAMPEP_0174262418 /NCGR_PEP_ID=MMETSP0439-20130205/12961_1 /TAXON_ID=0 /ORGANISM="Stereomyxa ramosa, Strain Chinc5" /LENGTH=851 /DNA_ID=CAMNT_0015347123 /DNA_START=649 /DNA_END=3204 /DNA_ORIENTATION=-